MKRTQSINLARMRKPGTTFLLKPLALAVLSATLSGCGDSQEAKIYNSLEDCRRELPDAPEQCEKAYQDALVKARETAPKFNSRNACEAEFGLGMCDTYRNSSGGNWFMPAMAGFMLGRALDNSGSNYYRNQPVFTSRARRSPVYDKWVTADGRRYGDTSRRRVLTGNKTFKPKPKVTTTRSRGGFGSSSVAKSSWGRSSWGGKRSSWGG
ncbi:MAG: DUF1190 domain-containing protein [Methylococcales bacterium]|nr:DUF1190 domain-containing protein [Methylococcales bacterium]